MKSLIKLITAGIIGFAALGVTAASADYRPDPCDNDHDHRSHAANYYDYYPGDRYFSGAYDRRRRGANFSITFGDGDLFFRNRGYNNSRRYYDNGYRTNRRRVQFRKALNTRFRARIIVKQEIVYRRRGERLVCTVTPRGPEAEYVPYKRLKRVARNHCSPNARIKIFA